MWIYIEGGQAKIMKNIRKTFLEVIRAAYWKQIENGFIFISIYLSIYIYIYILVFNNR